MLRVAAALLTMALVAPLSAQKPGGASAAALQGTWVFQSINDQAPPEGSPETSVTFKGDTYQQASAGQVNERGTFKVDASKKPMTIDLTIVEGSDAGKIQLGIFEVTGDTLRANFAQPGDKTRPAELKTAAGSLLLVAKKKKA